MRLAGFATARAQTSRNYDRDLIFLRSNRLTRFREHSFDNFLRGKISRSSKVLPVNRPNARERFSIPRQCSANSESSTSLMFSSNSLIWILAGNRLSMASTQFTLDRNWYFSRREPGESTAWNNSGIRSADISRLSLSLFFFPFISIEISR